MEDIKKLELTAKENIKLAQQEKDVAKQSKLIGEEELKKSKAREYLVNKEFSVAKVKREWAEKKLSLLIEKRNLMKKGFFEFSEADIKAEEDYAIYNQKIAVIQQEMAELNSEIGELETKIANKKVKLANEKVSAAKERIKLSKKQTSYIKGVNENLPEDKIEGLEKIYKDQEEALDEFRDYIIKKEKEIKEKENQISDLKKKLAQKFAEQDKVRRVEHQ